MTVRVLYITRFNPERIIGGIAEFLYFLPNTLKALDIQSYLYNQADEPSTTLQAPSMLKSGMIAYEGPFMKPGLFRSRKDLNPLLDLCEREKIDLIHAQETYRSGYLAYQVKKKLQIPYIITSHSDIAPQNSERIKRRSVRKRCREILQHADAVTHLTPSMAAISHEICDTAEKSKIIANGIDLTLLHASKTAIEKDYLLTIGRLEFEKGVHVLIDAYAELRKQGVKTSLVIAGTGSAEDALKNQVTRLGLNLVTDYADIDNIPPASVIFTGYVTGEKKNQLMVGSKIILFATQPQLFEEAFGIVQIEAMAVGKTMIASDIAATRYLQTLGSEGLLVKADDIAAWSNAILTFLRDDNKRQALGKANQEKSSQFDWKIIAKQYAKITN
jgi:glycogen(starch) synthase